MVGLAYIIYSPFIGQNHPLIGMKYKMNALDMSDEWISTNLHVKMTLCLG